LSSRMSTAIICDILLADPFCTPEEESVDAAIGGRK